MTSGSTAKGLIDKAKANKDTALTSLDAYSAEAPGQLPTTLKSNADKNLERHKAAATKVNYIIGEAKEIAKIQDEVLMQIVGAALGGLGGGALEVISDRAHQLAEGLTTAFKELSEFGLGTLVDGAGVAKGAMGMGTGDAAGPTIDTEGSGKELAFYKSFSALQANSTQLLALAVQVGKIGEPIGKVTEAIAGVRDSGQTRSDYPVQKIDKDAATLESSSRKLAAAAPGVAALLGELKDMAKRATLAAPKDDREVEKEIWKTWAAGLTTKDRDLLDLDGIENYLKRIGMWEELGIDRGSWFSDDEEGLATAWSRKRWLSPRRLRIAPRSWRRRVSCRASTAAPGPRRRPPSRRNAARERSVSSSSPVMPMTPFIGVRISWLMVARRFAFRQALPTRPGSAPAAAPSSTV